MSPPGRRLPAFLNYYFARRDYSPSSSIVVLSKYFS